jgi:hypothetical protein
VLEGERARSWAARRATSAVERPAHVGAQRMMLGLVFEAAAAASTRDVAKLVVCACSRCRQGSDRATPASVDQRVGGAQTTSSERSLSGGRRPPLRSCADHDRARSWAARRAASAVERRWRGARRRCGRTTRGCRQFRRLPNKRLMLTGLVLVGEMAVRERRGVRVCPPAVGTPPANRCGWPLLRRAQPAPTGIAPRYPRRMPLHLSE